MKMHKVMEGVLIEGILVEEGENRGGVSGERGGVRKDSVYPP